MKFLVLGLALFFSGCAIDYENIQEVVLEEKVDQLEKEIKQLKKFQKAIDLQTVYINYNVEATACITNEKICSLMAATHKVSNAKCEAIATECLNSTMHKRKKIENYKEFIHGRQTE